MEVSQIAGTQPVGTVSESTALGRDDFLLMLIAQLENQDPLNPQDGTEFTAQLAQFSSLEQEIAMRETLEDISASLAQGTSSTAIDLVGKEVVAKTPFIQSDGEEQEVLFELDHATESTSVEIHDSNGRVIRSLTLGPLDAGLQTFDWDGRTNSGNRVEPDVYTVTLTALSNGEDVSHRVLNEGVVSAADLTSSEGMLFLGNIVVPLADIREVRLANYPSDTNQEEVSP